MPDFSLLTSGANESAATPASSTGVTVSDASTDTKGTWTQLIAATAYPTAWVMITLHSTTVAAEGFLVDIGVGASTAEKVLIPDIQFEQASVASPAARVLLFPVSIPAGTRISARCANSTAGADSLVVGVTLLAATLASPVGMGQVEGFGSVVTGSTGTNVDPGAVAHTKGSWVQLIAATAVEYKWVCLTIAGNVLGAQTTWLLDLGIGANPNEKVLLPNIVLHGGTSTDRPLPPVLCLPLRVPAGARLSVRAQCNVTTATERVLKISGQGVG